MTKTISFDLPDKDYNLLVGIAKDQKRRLSDLSYLLYARGLDSFFCETQVSVKKTDDDYTDEDREQIKKNEELKKTEGWDKLSYPQWEEKGYKHVCDYIHNHVYNKKEDKWEDPLIEPLAERIESYAIEGIKEEN